jgi:hypothetical protein
MARGWESKDITAQQEMAVRPRLPQAPARDERLHRRSLLEQQRTRLLGELQRACVPRLRGLIEAELTTVNQRIAELG